MPGHERLVAGLVDDELERQPLRVREHERRVAALPADALVPEVERRLRAHAEHDAVHHPVPGVAASSARVLEERDIGAGAPALVRVEEVVDGRVVLVDRLLDEAQPE